LETDGIVSQNGSDGTVLNIEADVNNIGRQSSYGQDWRFHIKFEATEIEGSERFGLKRPEWTADEPELYNQEFSVGKPVRGWLYFAFPDSVSQQMRLIFNCTSPSPAVATLSFFDSKEKHLWEKEIDLVALIKNSCRSTPTNTAVAAAPPQGPQPAHRHSQPKNATGLPTTERPPLANFRNITALGGATAILDCDPLATFDGVTAVTTSQTEPALDIGSSKCQNQESFAEFGAYTQLKTDLGNDAGNKEAIKSDLGKLRKRLTELRDPLHLQKEYEDKLNRQFSDMETAFLAVADSREKTLHLLSGLRITHR